MKLAYTQPVAYPRRIAEHIVYAEPRPASNLESPVKTAPCHEPTESTGRVFTSDLYYAAWLLSAYHTLPARLASTVMTATGMMTFVVEIPGVTDVAALEVIYREGKEVDGFKFTGWIKKLKRMANAGRP